ncbi:hypothetical protein AGR1C_Lc10022 [Agrobacterium fabacearum TT111]|nr:hypothetical protein [Agrobacterium tumefaciens]CUW97026.1 hypothetical protein AGR1C_Lc10022 [Agrobacterium fabacearum TT111]
MSAGHQFRLFTDAHRQSGKVPIAQGNAETLKAFPVQQIHCIDDHGAIGSVLSGTVGKLLNRPDGMIHKPALPAPHVCLCPVVMDVPPGRITKRRGHAEQRLHDF